MPFNPANAAPGVYVFEIPSGVHTITGVSTSVTAFLGQALRGPANTAVHIFSFRDYQRSFGGLSSDSEMSYAVSQFFLNGGTEAWVVRLAKNAKNASVNLQDSSGNDTLQVTALDAGPSENGIQTVVENGTLPKTFNLSFNYAPAGRPADNRTETFRGLSMDKNSSHYVQDAINNVSQLVTVKVIPGGNSNPPVAQKPTAGMLTSGTINATDLNSLDDNKENGFRISFTGTGLDPDFSPVSIGKGKAQGANRAEKLSDVAARIQKAVQQKKSGLPAWRDFTCTVPIDPNPPSTLVDDLTLTLGDKKVQVLPNLVLTSGVTGGKAPQVKAPKAPDADNPDLNNIADALHLADAQSNKPSLQDGRGNPALSGGSEDPFVLNDDGLGLIFPSNTVIDSLETVDLFNLLCLPGVTDARIIGKAIEYCVTRRAFMIVDPPLDTSQVPPQSETPDQIATFINGPNLPKASVGEYAAIYYPSVQIADPLNNGKLRSFGASGTIAGLYARTDSNRGVWKAPAGTEAVLVGVQGLDVVLTDGQNGNLNSHGVNCLRVFPVFGAVCWGARTVSGDDEIGSEYKYIPVRRTALYIEESLYRGLKWAVFEPNDEPLWAQIRLNVGAFMHNLFVKGAFQGKTPREAYFVKCDKETTTQNDIDQGIVNVLVGFAPLKPAEFVVISLQQIAGQLQV